MITLSSENPEAQALSRLLITFFALTFAPLVFASEASAVFQQVKESIAIVVTMDSEGNLVAQGSGVALEPGLVVTNWHVVEGAKQVTVLTREKRVEAKVLRASAEPDLALLSVDTRALGLKTISLSRHSPEVGDRVFTIGAPSGLDKTFSDGIVSGVRAFHDYSYLQTTADISPGSSGGALVNAKGRLLGITTFKVSDNGGLNFAVPTEYVSKLAASKVNVLPEAQQEPHQPTRIAGKYILRKRKGSLTLFNPAEIAASRGLIAFTNILREGSSDEKEGRCGIEFQSRDVLDCLSQKVATLNVNVFNYFTGERATNNEGISLAEADWKPWPDSAHNDFIKVCGYANGNRSVIRNIMGAQKEAMNTLSCDFLSRDETFNSELKMKDGNYNLQVSLTRLGARCVQ